MQVKIRDSRHKYYKEKYEVLKVDLRNDEIVISRSNGKKTYLEGIEKQTNRLKRVVPAKIGSKLAIINLFKGQIKRGILTQKLQKQDKIARVKIEGDGKSTDMKVENLVKMV